MMADECRCGAEVEIEGNSLCINCDYEEQYQKVWRYPRTMGAVAAFNENMDYCTEETMLRAIEISKERGDDAVIRKDVEQAVAEAKEK